jgi:NADH:ubiquinone oxidoreductase subunit D
MRTRYLIFAFLGVLIASYLFHRIICNSIEIHELKQKIVLIERVDYLMIEEGYTRDAAEHIAKVELKIIPEDAEYIALMED